MSSAKAVITAISVPSIMALHQDMEVETGFLGFNFLFNRLNKIEEILGAYFGITFKSVCSNKNHSIKK